MPEIINNRIVRTNRELIEGMLKIRDKKGVIVPFKMNLSQEYYWARKKLRNLIIKPRQKGLSKVIDADQLIDCIRKPTNAVVISHEREATQRLFRAVKFYIDHMEIKPEVSIDSKSEIRFPKMDSSYYIGTAGQKAFGHGDTLHRAHLSEASRYPDLERIRTGVEEALGLTGQCDIETTANGRDQVYDLWLAAKEGRSSYTPIFIPWFIDGEYSVDNMDDREKDGMSSAVAEMIAVPDKDFMAGMNYDEKILVDRVLKEWGISLQAGQMKWRRYKLWDKGELFFQEYPEDDVSCFLQSGRTVFSQVTRIDNKRIPLNDLGSWKADDLEKKAIRKRTLYGGLDGAEGTLTGDAHSFAVIDVVGGKGTVVYEYTSNEPIDMFDEKIKRICKDSGLNIYLGVEKNGVGLAHVQRLRQLGVRIYEFETTGANRPVMITDLEEAYRKIELIETYPEAENELRDMEYGENNRAEHKKGKHDDRVFSRAIAWQMRKMPKPGISYV